MKLRLCFGQIGYKAKVMLSKWGWSQFYPTTETWKRQAHINSDSIISRLFTTINSTPEIKQRVLWYAVKILENIVSQISPEDTIKQNIY